MKTKKSFDAVKMMREIRDQLSEKFMKMTFEEQKKYIQSQLKHSDAEQTVEEQHN